MRGSQLVTRNVLAAVGTQLLSWALTFITTLYLPRYVGDTGLGKLAFAAAFVAIFGTVAPLGTSLVLVREIARDKTRAGELLSAALFLRIPLALLVGGAAVAAVHLLGYPAITRAVVLAYAVGMVISMVGDTLGAALQGQERLPKQSVASLVDRVIQAVLIISFIVARAPLWAIGSVGIFGGLVNLLVNLHALKGTPISTRWPGYGVLRDLVIAGLPFMGLTVFRALYGQTDPVVLSVVSNDANIGWYALATKLGGTAMFTTTALIGAVLPTLARLYKSDPTRFAELARRTFSLALLCGIPTSMVLVMAPGQVMDLLHYPASFRRAVPVLQVGGVGLLLFHTACVLGTIITACDGQSRMFKATVGATMAGIPLCFLGSWLGQHFWGNGATGAMASDVVLEIGLVSYYLRVIPRGTFSRQDAGFIVRCLAAALPVAGLLWLASPFKPGLWVGAPCALLYAALCWLLGCIDPRYFALMKTMAAQKTAAAADAPA